MSSLTHPSRLWRSLEELGDGGPCSSSQLAQVTPGLPDLDRRQFLQTLGASLALGGLGACSRPPQTEIVPYLQAPVGQIDGVPRFFPTVLTRDGYGHGVLVESNMGRPTKIEGNPQHPASLGSTDIFDQAAVLQLWDPDRSQSVWHKDNTASWDEFGAAGLALVTRFASNRGAGLHLLTGPSTSPTLAGQLSAFTQRYPAARWYVHQPAGDAQTIAGAQLAFGTPLATRLHLERAAVILALDADFLSDTAAGVRYARDFMGRRDPQGAPAQLARLYVVESTPSLTGATADHRLPLESVRLQRLAVALARRLGVPVDAGSDGEPQYAHWLETLAADLKSRRDAALIIVGYGQPPWMHALGHAMNQALGSVGTTVTLSDPPQLLAPATGTLESLVAAMHAGSVDTLVVLDANPAYDAPADLRFTDALERVAHLVHLGLYRDETGVLAEWHLPLAHQLEAWSDARAFDGTASIAQPLIAPLYGGHSAHELLAVLMGDELTDGLALVRRQWQRELPDIAAWNTALQAGVVTGTTFAPRPAALQPTALSQIQAQSGADDHGLELLFRPDPSVGDGRWSNNGWLQELPKPFTQLTWDNAALVSPALAARYALSSGDMIELRLADRVLRAPVWIMPGQAPGSITLHLGYGRRNAGRVADGRGVNAYALRSAGAAWCAPGLEIARTGASYPLASTQQHFRMEGRDPVQVETFEAYAARAPHAVSAADAALRAPTLYRPFPPGKYAWGMSIDLNACIGCNACTIACQAENNIPVVGKQEVQRGRQMHWIRVDRYYEGKAENPRSYSQPVPCMMCEHAPCELVCPVGATVHDSEGLNLQVYNRCVGTRFCSNNCPWKVRRFNFLQYVDTSIDSLKAQRNPEVSVRRRGVMEKCTYCIQRIQGAHIAAEREGRRIRDGEVLTACQAVCPTQAIRFGDVDDFGSQVSQAKASARNYLLLGELNTRPRTSYLTRLRNPNPALGDG